MTLGELISRFRREVKDTVKPYFCADEDIIAWLNEAEEEACRRAFLIVDSTSTASQLDIAAGDVGSDLDPLVIFVRRATLQSTHRPLIPAVVRSMDEELPGWENAQASVPTRFVPDWQTGYLRLYPPSRSADTIKLTVVRLPVRPMVEEDDEPEIRRQFHAYLLDWAKHRAYNIPDSDFFDAKKSDYHLSVFTQKFGETSAISEAWAMEQYYDVGAN